MAQTRFSLFNVFFYIFCLWKINSSSSIYIPQVALAPSLFLFIMCVCTVDVADEMSDVLFDLPDDDDDDRINRFTIECSQRTFPPVYYLQLDSRTE